ncbi:MAG: MFS transporter [Sedimentisphaerales bacterium]
MKVIIALDAIFTTGAADLVLASTPLWVFLGASSTQIGFINSLTIMSLVGLFLSPFISVRFKYKKWYLFLAHLPYIGTWGVMGLVLLLSRKLGLSDTWLLSFLTTMMGANAFFGGFVSLPHQEYTAACIPMSHRGRFAAYSQGFGSISAIASTAAGYWILAVVVKPFAWGFLYLMAWFLCQGGYVMAIFGRERPTPIEKAPRPWSREMFRAFWQDKPFVRIVIVNSAFQILLWPAVNIFIGNYGYKELGMAPKLAAVLMMITNIARIAFAGPIGHLTDKLHPKRILPYWPLVLFLAMLPVLIMRNALGVYISTAIGAVFMIGQYSAFLALIYGLPKPENRAGHYTIGMIQGGICQSIGPLIVGMLCDVLSFRVTFILIACASLALFPITKRLLSDISEDSRDYS